MFTSNAHSQFRAIDRNVVRPALKNNLRVATLDRNRLLAAPTPMVRRNGFGVPGTLSDDFTAKVLLDKATEQVGQIEGWLAAIDALETDLTMLGLTPIAVLPVALWRHLTQTAGVYRFEHFDKAGRVPAQPLGKFANFMARLNTMSNLELVAKLWPQLNDDISTGIQVTPYFPQSPEHFQQNLLRLGDTKYPVHIAAVPEAIIISRKEVLEAHVRANLVPPAAPEPTPEQDPILYTIGEDDRIVALLDYFGHYPEEEKLVQRAQDWCKEMMTLRRR